MKSDKELIIGLVLAAPLIIVLAVIIWVIRATPLERNPPRGPGGPPTITATFTVPAGVTGTSLLGGWCATPGDRGVTPDGTLVVCATGGTARATRWEPAQR